MLRQLFDVCTESIRPEEKFEEGEEKKKKKQLNVAEECFLKIQPNLFRFILFKRIGDYFVT